MSLLKSATRPQWSEVFEGWSWILLQYLKYERLWEVQIKWSIVDLHCLDGFSKVWEEGASLRWRWAEMNSHDWIYLTRICPCSLAGVVERGPPWVPGSAFRSSAKITMPEGPSFPLITCSVSSDSLKLSVHPDLVGRYTEITDQCIRLRQTVSARITLPNTPFPPRCLQISLCPWWRLLCQKIATPPRPLRKWEAQYATSSSLHGGSYRHYLNRTIEW